MLKNVPFSDETRLILGMKPGAFQVHCKQHPIPENETRPRCDFSSKILAMHSAL